MKRGSLITGAPLDLLLNARQRRLDKLARERPDVGPAAAVDVPRDQRADLARHEHSAPLRLTRGRWAEVAKYDQRVAELEQRQRDLTAELQRLEQQRASAPAQHANALAAWEEDDRRGPRPESDLAVIELGITAARDEFEGLTVAVQRVLDEKRKTIERHRQRLVDDAQRELHEAHQRLATAIDVAEQARSELAEARSTLTWAQVFPDPVATRNFPRVRTLCGGLVAPLQRTLGQALSIDVHRAFDALRADADWVATAVSPEQRAVLARSEDQQADLRRGAVWRQSPEGVAAERAEQQRRREEHLQVWGSLPA
jgi:hypothetical protein